ncbi:S66 peptidase family protein [Mesobacillus zeae]|uniref:LD-carboxypeptidase n=1 Tax=Mesobacillus zeae TaxID=1917180 RepID=A0A398B2V8_9BACI|nr:S66 peptidase family protein [Mesobacillus zeae]RID84122.1 LD-carboxypeptidase [Mesobacillus zeae]
MIPDRLKPGDEIRVVAPSTSMAILKEAQLEIAQNRLEQLGFTVTYGKYTSEHDEFFSTSVDQRLEDLHDAFADPNVKCIIAALGGYNSNQLLKGIDYDLIAKNPKVLCGYSDITAMQLAIHTKTGLVTYSGPFFSSFGAKHGFEYTLNSFLDAVTNDAPFDIEPSEQWSDDSWHLEQENRTFHENPGYLVVAEGEAEGKLVGGNLSTMNLLKGTEFMPSLKDSILFIEDDDESHVRTFDRDLQSLLQMPDAGGIRAVLIGRFKKDSVVTEAAIMSIIASKAELRGIPIIANVNFGHVQPIATIPAGCRATVKAADGKVEITVLHEE